MTVGAIAGALAAGLAGDAPPPGPQQARAETVVSDEAELSFDRAFFEPFRPSSALDMINRVPGFSYHKGDGGVRGLAGASGNVLIDGQRPVVKSVSLDDVIRRIPATAVLRIDVVRGGSSKLDMQGHAVVANIVRDPAGFFSVTGEVMTKFYTDHRPGRHGRLEAAMSRGDLAMNGAFVWRDEKEQANTGTGRADRIDVVHGHRNRGRFETAWDREVAQANGSLEYTAGRNLFRVNVSGELEDNLQRDETRLTGPGGSHEDAVIRDFQSDQAEISVDYEHTVSERLSARLLALKRVERDRTQSHSYGRGLPQTSREKAVEDESILRLAATWLASARLTWETSAEGSINVLDKTSSLVRAGLPVDLPSDEIRVEEKRANFDSGLRWQVRDGLSLEVGLGFETSTIGQTGDVEQSRSLRYWKPRANLTVDPVPDVQFRLRAEQIVGQLNFNDFAASISPEPGSVSAGNPDLVPERRWLFEAAVEHRFWDRGAVTLSASHAEVRDVVDLIPIDNRFDAPGNIGGGVRQEMKLSFALPLERLSVPGGLIRFNGTWRRSEVVDPVTGEERRISWERPFAGDLVISKDLPGLDSVIGADLFMGFKEVSYRLHERRSERSTSDPLARLYWDWTPDPKTTLRIQIENMSFRKRSQERVFYRGPRANDDIAAIERRSATLDPFLMLRLRRRL